MISNEDWQKFVDTGKVELRVIKDLVKRMKVGTALDVKDLAIYRNYSEMIETLLKL